MDKYTPLFTSIFGGLVRMALGGVIAWLLQQGLITPDQTEMLIAGLVTLLMTAFWIGWNKVKDARRLNTAAAIGKPATIEEIKALIASGISAPAATPTNERPVLTGTGDGSIK